jgi:hypothetical protein
MLADSASKRTKNLNDILNSLNMAHDHTNLICDLPLGETSVGKYGKTDEKS